VGKPFPLVVRALLALPTAAVAAPWREEPAVADLFSVAGMEGTVVLLDERRGELRGHNRGREEKRFSPASAFKIVNARIGLSLGAERSLVTWPQVPSPTPLERHHG
jgi:beta-lactamase class D